MEEPQHPAAKSGPPRCGEGGPEWGHSVKEQLALQRKSKKSMFFISNYYSFMGCLNVEGKGHMIA